MENNYPELWEVAQGIEGLINGSGIHAGGVIFVDEPFTNSTALMKSPRGETITQFELHDSEKVGLIKYDILSIEALDKIHNCIDLLCDYGYAERKGTLKETYESILNVYTLERNSSEMWKMCWNHKVSSLFQMEKQSGISGIAAMKPTSVDDLAILNSVIRLMAQEIGGEMPVNKLARFKNDSSEWDFELRQYGLGDKERELLEPIIGISYGLCITQEQFMQLVQLPELGGFDLTWADKLRKAIAKKNPAGFDALEKEFYKTTAEKGCNEKLCRYVWEVLISMSKGYGFNASHTLAYSIVALQELNLAYRYPIIFWNCACLIADAGGAGTELDSSDDQTEEENETCIEEYEFIEDFIEDDEEEKEEDSVEKKDKKKKKNNSTDYGKIATAIGNFKSGGITITGPNINSSDFTFSPDVDNNLIVSGIKGITKVGEDIVKEVIKKRPYTSIQDFLIKVKVNKPQMINLIKSGAFDCLGDRKEIMKQYIKESCGEKKRLNLQNMKMLIDYNLIPQELDYEKKVYCYNKYLKKIYNSYKKTNGTSQYYYLDSIAYKFFENNYDVDMLLPSENEDFIFQIKQTIWDKIYNKTMDPIRNFLKENQQEILNKLNKILFDEMWDKYCKGTISSWEMDSISYYIHPHELESINNHLYGFSDYFALPESPEVSYYFTPKNGNKRIPMFKLNRIVGTVLNKEKTKKTITLLTTSGVVMVKLYGGAFTFYDKQISERGSDGVKHVLEKSIFTRGNKIIVTGIKRDGMFFGKKYKNTPYHLIEQITKINDDGTIETRTRIDQEE